MIMISRRLLASKSIRRLLSSLPHDNKSSGSGKLLLTGAIFAGITLGTAYGIEHKYIPDDIAQNLSFLSPLQELLREAGMGNNDVGMDESIAELYKPIPDTVEEKQDATPEDNEGAIEPDPKKYSTQESEVSDKIEAVENVGEVEVEEVTAPHAEQESSSEEVTIHVPVESQQKETSSLSGTQTDISPAIPEIPSSSFTTDSERLLALRVHALDRTLNDISSDMTTLQTEAEQSLSKDLQDLDVESLRKKIVHLNAEMLERIRWEGLRQQQAVQAAEAQYAQLYGTLLAQQRSELLVEAERRLFEKEKGLINSYRSEIDDLKRAHEKELQNSLAEQQKQLADLSVVDLEKAQAALQEDMNQAHTLQMAMVKEQHVKSLLQVQNDVSANNIQLALLRDAVKSEFDKTCVSHETHAMSAAVLLMERALLAGKNVKNEVAVLKAFAPGE